MKINCEYCGKPVEMPTLYSDDNVQCPACIACSNENPSFVHDGLNADLSIVKFIKYAEGGDNVSGNARDDKWFFQSDICSVLDGQMITDQTKKSIYQ